MSHLSDDLLNRYIDNELDIQELNMLNEHIKNCEICLRKLKAQKAVDMNLRKASEFKLPDSFTESVMKQIYAIKPATQFKPRKSYFLRFIYIFLGFCVMSVFVLGLYEAFQLSSTADAESSALYSNIVKHITLEFNFFIGLFRNQTVSLIGGAFTFILLISAYFIYDSHKSFKNRLNNLR